MKEGLTANKGCWGTTSKRTCSSSCSSFASIEARLAERRIYFQVFVVLVVAANKTDALNQDCLTVRGYNFHVCRTRLECSFPYFQLSLARKRPFDSQRARSFLGCRRVKLACFPFLQETLLAVSFATALEVALSLMSLVYRLSDVVALQASIR